MRYFRFISSFANQIGSPDGLLTYLYTVFLREVKLDQYRYIHIDHINDDRSEIIVHMKKDVHINIKYDVPTDLAAKSDLDKQLFYVEVIHTALLRIAAEDKNIDVGQIEQVKRKIIENKLSFEITYKIFKHKKIDGLVVKIVVSPLIDRFNFYALIEKNSVERCRLKIYSGLTMDAYFDDFFFYGKWQGDRKFIISGKESEIEIHIDTEECSLQFVNIYENKNKAPLFEMMKADADKEKDLKDYINSLNPAIATILTQSLN